MIRAVSPYNIHSISLANGCEVAYIDEGSGSQTLVFIHGLATYALSWRRNIEYLKQYYRCIAIDLPGNGFSGRGDYPYGINFFSGCVMDFIKRLGLQNVVLAGHSMGGQVALNLVINEPDIAEKLVLCAPAGFEQFTIFERTMYSSAMGFFDLFTTEENSLRNTIYASFYHVPKQADEMVNELVELMKTYPISVYRRMIEGCVNGMLNEPVYDSLHKIQQPTLVLFGEQDALIPNKLIHMTSTRRIAEEGAAKIPDSNLQMILRCGHFLQIEEAEKVNEAIRGFIHN